MEKEPLSPVIEEERPNEHVMMEEIKTQKMSLLVVAV